jgi:predicted Zn-dependent protease
LSKNVSNEEAVGWIKELFSIWQNAKLETSLAREVNVVDLDIEYDGSTRQEININNFNVTNVYSNAQAVFVFDETGEIIDQQLGDKAHNHVVGFATPLSRGGSYFVGGVVVMNGLFADKMRESTFKAAILHEMGHLLNLDHTQANIEAATRLEDGDASLIDEIPTMYPILYSDDQLSLNIDDKVSLAEQYPTPEYLNDFCSVIGSLEDASGDGFQGADVIARAMDDVNAWSDVRTIVSGVLYPAGTKSGEYVLGGLVPERVYEISYRAIDAGFSGGSSLAPYDPPRADVVGGIIGKNIVACSKGATTEQQMDIVNIDPNTNDQNKTTTNASSAPAGCSLIR